MPPPIVAGAVIGAVAAGYAGFLVYQHREQIQAQVSNLIQEWNEFKDRRDRARQREQPYRSQPSADGRRQDEAKATFTDTWEKKRDQGFELRQRKTLSEKPTGLTEQASFRMSEPFSLHPGSEAAAVGLSVTPDEFPSAQNLLTPNEAFHASESHQDVNDSVEARSEFALSETSATQATSPLFSNGTLVDAEDWSNSSGNHEFARAGRSGSDFELDSSWSELGDSSSDEQMENQWSQAQGRHSPTALIA